MHQKSTRPYSAPWSMLYPFYYRFFKMHNAGSSVMIAHLNNYRFEKIYIFFIFNWNWPSKSVLYLFVNQFWPPRLCLCTNISENCNCTLYQNNKTEIFYLKGSKIHDRNFSLVHTQTQTDTHTHLHSHTHTHIHTHSETHHTHTHTQIQPDTLTHRHTHTPTHIYSSIELTALTTDRPRVKMYYMA